MQYCLELPSSIFQKAMQHVTYSLHCPFGIPNLSSIFPLRILEGRCWMFCPQCFCNGLHHKGHDEGVLEYVGMDLVSVPLYARNKLEQLYFVSSIPQLLFSKECYKASLLLISPKCLPTCRNGYYLSTAVGPVSTLMHVLSPL